MWLLLELLCAAAVATPPHIINILADDLGFYDTRVHNPVSPTPVIGNLSQAGVILERAYAFRYCSPTRRAMLSGRFPNHITNTQASPCSNWLPLEFQLISQKLKGANYSTHFIGKGHLGYETTDHLPINRGFDSHVGYLGGGEGYEWGGGSEDPTKGHHDMWHDHLPGIDVVPQLFYSANYYTSTAVNIIKRHAAMQSTQPLFLHLMYQNVHAPYSSPPKWECHDYPEMWDQTFANMLHMLDDGIGNVTAALKAGGMWDNTLLVFNADNGGIGPANNHPLRGHKHDAWEGGTRVTSFVSGGAVPAHVRGTRNHGLVHIVDWYATFCGLAGVDPRDDALFEGKVRPTDSVDVWPLITGGNATQPREHTPTSEYGLIWGTRYKVVVLSGQSNYYTPSSVHYVPKNATLPCLAGHQPSSGDNPVTGCPVCNSTLPCLFDLLADPHETTNIAAAHPDIVQQLVAKLNSFKAYGTFKMNATQLAKYTKLADPSTTWRGFMGPCYVNGTAPPPPPPPAPCTTCKYEKDTHYPGGDIRTLNNIKTQGACCEACNHDAACVKFVFNPPEFQCKLKGKAGAPAHAPGLVSGECADMHSRA